MTVDSFKNLSETFSRYCILLKNFFQYLVIYLFFRIFNFKFKWEKCFFPFQWVTKFGGETSCWRGEEAIWSCVERITERWWRIQKKVRIWTKEKTGSKFVLFSSFPLQSQSIFCTLSYGTIANKNQKESIHTCGILSIYVIWKSNLDKTIKLYTLWKLQSSPS